MLRRTPLRRKAAKVLRRSDTGPRPDTVFTVLARAKNRCEICGHRMGLDRGTLNYNLHHRRPRAMGGSRRSDTNSPANLLALCLDCHSDVESNRALALENGWLLPQTATPSKCAVLLYRESVWVYLTDDGRYSDHPEA